MSNCSYVCMYVCTRDRAPIYSHFGYQLKGDKLGASVEEADVEADLVDVPGGGGHRGVEGARGVRLPLSVDQVGAGRRGIDVAGGAEGGLDHGLDVVGRVVGGGDKDGWCRAEVGGGRAGALVHRAARIWCRGGENRGRRRCIDSR